MGLCDRCKLLEGNVGDTLADEDLSCGDQIACLLERHFDVVGCLGEHFGVFILEIESDVCLEGFPLIIVLD